METFTERGTIKTIATHYIEGRFRLRQNSVGRGDCVVWLRFPHTSSDESTTNSGPINDAIAAARLTERKRIARELHDTLLQGCLGVSMQLHATVDDLSPDSSEKKRLSDTLQLARPGPGAGTISRRGTTIPHGAHCISRRRLCRCSHRSWAPFSDRVSSRCSWQGEGVEGWAE